MYLKDSTWHTRYRSNFGLFKIMIVLTEKRNLLLKTWLGYFFFSSSINYWSKTAWLSPTRCMILYVNWRFLCFYSNKIKIWIWAFSAFNKKCWLLNWNKKVLSSLKSHIEYLVLKGNQLAMKINTFEICIPVI